MLIRALGHFLAMPTHFENGENVTVANSKQASTRCRNNLTTVGNLKVTNILHSLQEFNAKEGQMHLP